MKLKQIKELFIRRDEEIFTNEQLSAEEFREIGSAAVAGLLRAEQMEATDN